MNFKTTLAALTLAFGLAQGASAATIDFTSGGTGAGGQVGAGPLSYTASAASSFAPASAAVSVSNFGLGVRHTADTQPGQIDGTFTTSETLTVTFSWAVNLLNFTLGRIDFNDDFQVAFNGGGFASFGPGLSNPYTGAGQNNVTSFRIRASGSNFLDIDNFTLAAATVAPVPVPAAGFMLLAGLAGLAGLRRRKALV